MSHRHRPDGLRSTPLIDRSEVPQEWTNRWRFQLIDLFSGPGGVGRAVSGNAALPLHRDAFAGFDICDYSDEYPGRFGQVDLLDDPDLSELAQLVDMDPQPFARSVPVDRGHITDEYGLPTLTGLTSDVVWCSFPCRAYSSLSPTAYGSREAALEANPRITDDLRAFLLDLAPHYVIENVPGATRVGDLEANVRVNGLAFGRSFDLERHFETTFPVPDAYQSGDPEVVVDTRDDQSIAALAEAKGVPKEWGRQAVRSALVPEYVHWILSHCPAVPSLPPQRKRRGLGRYGSGVGEFKQWPESNHR